jgi:hypothetical protein
LVLNRVGGEVHRTDVVVVDQRAPGERSVELDKKLPEPGGLSHAVSDSRYSASALERETTGWRLDDQDTRLPPKKTA